MIKNMKSVVLFDPKNDTTETINEYVDWLRRNNMIYWSDQNAKADRKRKLRDHTRRS